MYHWDQYWCTTFFQKVVMSRISYYSKPLTLNHRWTLIFFISQQQANLTIETDLLPVWYQKYRYCNTTSPRIVLLYPFFPFRFVYLPALKHTLLEIILLWCQQGYWMLILLIIHYLSQVSDALRVRLFKNSKGPTEDIFLAGRVFFPSCQKNILSWTKCAVFWSSEELFVRGYLTSTWKIKIWKCV